MRKPTLQYFYLQKPMTLLLIISVITVLCWIGLGDFYTKGEPREASVAISMIEKNQWILPEAYADEIAYKPPLTHWLMAVFSLPKGEVTPFTSRLPSALGFIGLVCFSFIFFGKNLKFQDAFLACLIILTSFELHRAAMTARVDMMLTFLIVLALERLFRWEERKQLKGFPLVIPLILGLAALIKGPVGIILPLLVFGIYLICLRYNFGILLKQLCLVGLAALVLPSIWYFMAYQLEGKEFLDLIYAENLGRFFHDDTLNIKYKLGHDESIGFLLTSLVAGFIPWTILLVISLFGLNYCRKMPSFKEMGKSLLEMPKIKLFSLIAAVVIILFYCIPSSKRSVYIMPAYPFIAIFIAQYALYLTEYHSKVMRAFGFFIGFIASLVLLIGLFTIFIPILDPVYMTGLFTQHQKTLDDVATIFGALSPNFLSILLFVVLTGAIFVLFRQLWKKNNIKVLYGTIAVYFALFLVMDGVFFPAFKNGISAKPFAENLKTNYPIDQTNLFVMNNLLEYSNMYGLNYYLNNSFHNFETTNPKEGYFLVGENSYQKVEERYGDQYAFDLLEVYQNKSRDGEKIIQFYHFTRK